MNWFFPVLITILGYWKIRPLLKLYRIHSFLQYYNKDGLEHKEEYVKMFSDCGWEYLMDYAGYSYFRKPVSETGVAEEIFCDDESKIMMMERVLKGRMLPLLVLFLCVLLPQFILNIFNYRNYVLATFLGGILAVYIIIFSWCAVKYNKIKNKK